MSDQTKDLETIYDGLGSMQCPISAEIDRTDPGDPVIRLEAGCNEFWLNADEARALFDYLERTLPVLEAVHD